MVAQLQRIIKSSRGRYSVKYELLLQEIYRTPPPTMSPLIKNSLRKTSYTIQNVQRHLHNNESRRHSVEMYSSAIIGCSWPWPLTFDIENLFSNARMNICGKSHWNPPCLVWLTGAVVFASCCRGSNCSLARAMDGRISAAAPLALADQLPLVMTVKHG